MRARITHPSWCDVGSCPVTETRLHHSHVSVATVVPTVDPNPIRIEMRLSQGHTDEPLLILVDVDLGDGDEPVSFPLYVIQALTFAQKLRRIVGYGTRRPWPTS